MRILRGPGGASSRIRTAAWHTRFVLPALLRHRSALRRAAGCRAESRPKPAGGCHHGRRPRDLAGRCQCARHPVSLSCSVAGRGLERHMVWSACAFVSWRSVSEKSSAVHRSSPAPKVRMRGSGMLHAPMSGLALQAVSLDEMIGSDGPMVAPGWHHHRETHAF